MTAHLLSWGRYPRHAQSPMKVHWRSEIGPWLERFAEGGSTTLAYGNGRSYGDSCLASSDQVIAMGSLDRVLAADWERGRLVVEAGLTLSDILQLAVPRGWFLPVTPGTKFVTIGGAIANDVHGKNHHRQGTFGSHVARFGLYRSADGRIECSATENAELFAASIGGLGLTGIIDWAEIHLTRIQSSDVMSVAQRFDSLSEFMALSAELDLLHEYSVSWIDCAAAGKKTGRGVYMSGDFAEDGPLQVNPKRPIGVPVTPPMSLVNSLSLRTFNEFYFRRHPRARTTRRLHFDPFFYPLDGVLNWNRIYGRAGFQQYQCVVPQEVAGDALGSLLGAISAAGQGSFLAVLKCFGDKRSPGLLSFPRPGVTLALDFPNRPNLVEKLFRHLDSIVHEAGGCLYPAKDAHMQGNHFRQAYPHWKTLEHLRDPALNSRFWERVTR